MPRGLRALLAAALLFGGALRLAHYLDRRSLWLDECMLVLNVAARSFAELARPLDYNQAAPLLFLWAERLAVAVAGVGELSLRAVPLAAGLAVVALVGPVARRVSGDAAAAAAAFLAALSPVLIRYSNEAKPYETDALLALLLVAAALRVAESPTRARWIALAAAGALAVLGSIPGVFVAGAAVAALLLHPRVGRAHLPALAGCAGAWALLFAALYLLVYRPAATNPIQHQGYARAFLVPGAMLPANVHLAARGTLLPLVAGDGTGLSGGSRTLAAVALALVAGLAWTWRKSGGWVCALLAGPLALAVAASALRLYPVGVPRLMVFTAPLLLVLAGSAAGWAGEAARGRARPAVLAAAGLACAAPFGIARVEAARRPWKGEDARALVAAFRERPRSDEPVYVSARGAPSWVFYTTNWESPNRERLAFYAAAERGDGPAFENAAPRGRPVAPGEGDGLVYRYRSRREVLGLSSGAQWRWPEYVKRAPDEGWAANEARRIAREANPCAWLYYTHVSDGTSRAIGWQLRDFHRADADVQLTVPGGTLWRYCLPYTPDQLRQMEEWQQEMRARDAGEKG